MPVGHRLRPTLAWHRGTSERRLFRILDAEGNEVGPVPKALGDDDLVAMLRLCIFGREFDKKAISLQRRGKLGTFAPMSGQEAVVVGSVFALDREHDWVVPQYREQLAMLHWGLELSTYFLQRQGHPLGSDAARARPAVPPAGRPRRPPAARRRRRPGGCKHQGEPSVAACYFGDGSTSEGDFHEACNLAGVVKAPVIFVCQNNQWAISTPLSAQTAGVIADRAAGYGIAGVRVDGNDALAMYQVTAEAARAGARRRRPDADRGGHVPARRPHHGRRPDALRRPRRGGAVEARATR